MSNIFDKGGPDDFSTEDVATAIATPSGGTPTVSTTGGVKEKDVILSTLRKIPGYENFNESHLKDYDKNPDRKFVVVNALKYTSPRYKNLTEDQIDSVIRKNFDFGTNGNGGDKKFEPMERVSRLPYSEQSPDVQLMQSLPGVGLPTQTLETVNPNWKRDALIQPQAPQAPSASTLQALKTIQNAKAVSDSLLKPSKSPHQIDQIQKADTTRRVLELEQKQTQSRYADILQQLGTAGAMPGIPQPEVEQPSPEAQAYQAGTQQGRQIREQTEQQKTLGDHISDLHEQLNRPDVLAKLPEALPTDKTRIGKKLSEEGDIKGLDFWTHGIDPISNVVRPFVQGVGAMVDGWNELKKNGVEMPGLFGSGIPIPKNQKGAVATLKIINGASQSVFSTIPGMAELNMVSPYITPVTQKVAGKLGEVLDDERGKKIGEEVGKHLPMLVFGRNVVAGILGGEATQYGVEKLLDMPWADNIDKDSKQTIGATANTLGFWAGLGVAGAIPSNRMLVQKAFTEDVSRKYSPDQLRSMFDRVKSKEATANECMLAAILMDQFKRGTITPESRVNVTMKLKDFKKITPEFLRRYIGNLPRGTYDIAIKKVQDYAKKGEPKEETSPTDDRYTQPVGVYKHPRGGYQAVDYSEEPIEGAYGSTPEEVFDKVRQMGFRGNVYGDESTEPMQKKTKRIPKGGFVRQVEPTEQPLQSMEEPNAVSKQGVTPPILREEEQGGNVAGDNRRVGEGNIPEPTGTPISEGQEAKAPEEVLREEEVKPEKNYVISENRSPKSTNYKWFVVYDAQTGQQLDIKATTREGAENQLKQKYPAGNIAYKELPKIGTPVYKRTVTTLNARGDKDKGVFAGVVADDNYIHSMGRREFRSDAWTPYDPNDPNLSAKDKKEIERQVNSTQRELLDSYYANSGSIDPTLAKTLIDNAKQSAPLQEPKPKEPEPVEKEPHEMTETQYVDAKKTEYGDGWGKLDDEDAHSEWKKSVDENAPKGKVSPEIITEREKQREKEPFQVDEDVILNSPHDPGNPAVMNYRGKMGDGKAVVYNKKTGSQIAVDESWLSKKPLVEPVPTELPTKLATEPVKPTTPKVGDQVQGILNGKPTTGIVETYRGENVVKLSDGQKRQLSKDWKVIPSETKQSTPASQDIPQPTQEVPNGQERQAETETKAAEIAEPSAGAVSATPPESAKLPETGKPFDFTFIHNKEKSPKMGSRFGQDVEPAGKYIQEGNPENVKHVPNFESGQAHFENPLVIPFGGGYGEPSNWKNVLSKQFGGKKGKALSEAIRKAGYDGIVTTEKGHTSEIVDLQTTGLSPLEKQARSIIDKANSWEELPAAHKGEKPVANPLGKRVRELANEKFGERNPENFPVGSRPVKMSEGYKAPISMPDGTKRKGKFALVEMDDVKPSHDPMTFANTEGYPATKGESVNDRNYKEKGNQATVIEAARNLDPDKLITNAVEPAVGAPIITRDGNVALFSKASTNRILFSKSSDGKPLFRAVAVKYKGKVYEGELGEIHSAILNKLFDKGIMSPEDYKSWDELEWNGDASDGFITTEGKFLDRRQAYKFIKSSGNQDQFESVGGSGLYGGESYNIRDAGLAAPSFSKEQGDLFNEPTGTGLSTAGDKETMGSTEGLPGGQHAADTEIPSERRPDNVPGLQAGRERELVSPERGELETAGSRISEKQGGVDEKNNLLGKGKSGKGAEGNEVRAGQPPAETEGKTRRSDILPKDRERHRRHTEALRRGILDAGNGSPSERGRLYEALKRGEDVLRHDEAAYDDPEYLEARAVAQADGLDYIPVIDETKFMNSCIFRGAVFAPKPPDPEFTRAIAYKHEYGHDKMEGLNEPNIDVNTEAFKYYAAFLSRLSNKERAATGWRVSDEYAKRELAADLAAMGVDGEHYDIRLGDCVFDENKVVTYEQFKSEQSRLPDTMGARGPPQHSYAGQKAAGYKPGMEGSFSSLYDKKERFEIDDSGAKLKYSPEEIIKLVRKNDAVRAKSFDPNDLTRLGDILDHSELYKEYPDARYIHIYLSDENENAGTIASYNPDQDVIAINPNAGDIANKKELVHEIQHAIQKREGFARGTSMARSSILDGKTIIQRKIDKNTQEYDRLIKKADEPGISDNRQLDLLERAEQLQALIAQQRDALDHPENHHLDYWGAGYDGYKLSAGEMEARDAAARSNLTAEQRRSSPPYTSENINPQDAIVQFSRASLAGVDPDMIYDPETNEATEDETLNNWLGKINDTIDSLDFEKNEVYAVRGDGYIPKNRFRPSMQSPDQEKHYRLPGVSAVYVGENAAGGDNQISKEDLISQIKTAKLYGDNVFLLKGEKVGSGNDEWNDEVILRNHKIIGVLKSGNRTQFSRASLAGVDPDKLDDPEVIADAQKEWLEKGEDSKYFKRWFGNSKIVDDDGKPLVVYHGTLNASFDKFDLSKSGSATDVGMFGKGIYFTPKADIASRYAQMWHGQAQPAVYPVYLSIKNPIVLSSWTAPFPEPIESEMSEFMKNPDNRGFMLNKNRANFVRQKVLENGYDGLIIKEHIGPPDDGWDEISEIIAYDPEQVKSSIGNRGTFDDTDRILFSKADEKPILEIPEWATGTIKKKLQSSIANRDMLSSGGFSLQFPEYKQLTYEQKQELIALGWNFPTDRMGVPRLGVAQWTRAEILRRKVAAKREADKPLFSKSGEEAKKALKKGAKNIKAVHDDFKKIWFASDRGENARLSAESQREKMSERQRTLDQIDAAVDESRKYMDKFAGELVDPESVGAKFINAVETNTVNTLPKEQQPIAQVSKDIMDKLLIEVQKRGAIRDKKTSAEKEQSQDFDTFYFPRLWKDRDEKKAIALAAKMAQSGRYEGSKGFVRQRHHEQYLEGLAAGLEPATNNPIDMILLKASEMTKWIQAQDYISEEIANGRLALVPPNKKAPEGWKQLDDPIGTVTSGYNVPVWKVFEEMAKSAKKPLYEAEFGVDLFADAKGDEDLQDEINNLEWKNDKTGRTTNIYGMHRATGKSYSQLIVEKLLAEKDSFADEFPGIYDRLDSIANDEKKIQDILGMPAFEDLKTRIPVGGLIVKGHYYAPEESATVFNNYMSKGLRTNAAFRGYLKVSNTLNNFQLGMSAFHAGFTTMDAAITTGATGSKYLVSSLNQVFKDKDKAARFFKEGLLLTAEAHVAPVAALINIKRGMALKKEWLVPGSMGEEIAKQLEIGIAGGMRARRDSFYATKFAKKMKEAFARKTVWGYGAGTWYAPFALVEKTAIPVLEKLVPLQKMGCIALLAQYEIEKNPGMSHEQMREVGREIVDTVDHRMGQIIYDNLFWNKAAKDVALASVRSVGWNYGDVILGAGAVKDIGVNVGRGARWTWNKAKGKEPGKGAEFTHRMAYALYLPYLAAFYGAVFQYLMCGKLPGEKDDGEFEGFGAAFKDLYFPRTGGTDNKGRPRRVSLPTYMKDAYAYVHDFVGTIGHKLNPLPAAAMEFYQNKDYNNVEIVHPDDPLFQKGIQVLEHVAKTMEPFAFRNLQKALKDFTPTMDKVLPFVGVVPAPASVNKTKLENDLDEYGKKNAPSGTRTKEESQKHELMYRLAQGLRLNHEEGMKTLQEAYNDKAINYLDMVNVQREATRPSLVRRANRIPYPELVKMMEDATPEEKKQLEDVMKLKKLRYEAQQYKQNYRPEEHQ